MGICSSCLGLNRHPSQERAAESDPLLSDAAAQQYGATSLSPRSYPDEEDLQREREMLGQITARATENMIDVQHPNASDLTHYLVPYTTRRREPADADTTGTSASTADHEVDANEQAWLESIQSLQSERGPQIKTLKRGALVLDLGQLREASGPSTRRQ
nr:hypothetical protein B0A51_11953 [Rachicladosporium sp. CCFEE 5018]